MTEERYVISDLTPSSLLDMNTGETYPLQDEGIFETVCILLNAQNSLIEEKNEKITNLFIEKERLKSLLLQFYTEDEIEAEMI